MASPNIYASVEEQLRHDPRLYHAYMLGRQDAPTPAGDDRALREALRTVRDDFDHDEDAHRYGTTCRVCLAVVALNEVGRFREPWDDRARAALAPRPTPEDRTDG